MSWADWAKAHPNRAAQTKWANIRVRVALKQGKIVRKDACEECGKVGPTDASHEDYKRVLDVRFLCRKCHVRSDVERPKTDPNWEHPGFHLLRPRSRLFPPLATFELNPVGPLDRIGELRRQNLEAQVAFTLAAQPQFLRSLSGLLTRYPELADDAAEQRKAAA